MNTYQLHAILKSHYHTRNTFQDVVAANNVPLHIVNYPCFYICNKDYAEESGSHWIVLLFPHPQAPAEMFDSRAMGLANYSERIQLSLKLNGNGRIKTNHFPYQAPDTTTCGMFCLWFADMRNRNINFDTCLALLSTSDLESNERKIQRFVTTHMTVR